MRARAREKFRFVKSSVKNEKTKENLQRKFLAGVYCRVAASDSRDVVYGRALHLISNLGIDLCCLN